MEKLTKREMQALKTRLNIIQSGMELLKEQEYDSITIRDISSKANVSIGAIYHHFNSKEDIINSGYAEFDNYLEKVFEIVKNQTSYEQIQKIIQIQAEFTNMNGVNIPRHVFKNQLINRNKYILDKDRYFYVTLLDIVEKGISNKEIVSDLSAQEITDTILRLSRGVIYDWCLHDGEYDLKEYLKGDLERLLKNWC